MGSPISNFRSSWYACFLEKLRAFARNYLNHYEAIIQYKAISALSIVGEPSDINILVRIAEEGKQGVSRRAISAIKEIKDRH